MSTVQLSFFEQMDENGSSILEWDENGDERPETYTGMYAMHKYWSKKPHNLVARYIERFAQPGEIILDPFCGSGVTIVESVRLGRRAVGLDINPIAVLSTRMGLEHVDLGALKTAFDALRKVVAERINRLYSIECLHCGNPNATATHTIWEHEQPKEIWVACPTCQINKDVRVSSDANALPIHIPIPSSDEYPAAELIENSRINAKAGTKVADLFTPRALSALSLLLAQIRQIEDSTIRQVMEFCFSAALPQASNLVFVIRRRGKAQGSGGNGRAEVGSWVIGYWVPVEHFEIHVWHCFENRFRRILRGKQEVNFAIPSSIRKCDSLAKLSSVQEGYWVSQGTATSLALPSESVDYIFTDPPHGNRIPYLELSLIWNAWLGFECDWEDEIVISEAKGRHKDTHDYHYRLTLAFDEMWRVLKPGRYLSVAFNSLDDEAWLSLLNILLAAGFAVVQVSPLAYSARSVIQDTRKNALKTDFVITCQKCIPKSSRKVAFTDSQPCLEKLVWEYLSAHNGGVETYEVLNHLLVNGIMGDEMFRVSNIIGALERLGGYTAGRWYPAPRKERS